MNKILTIIIPTYNMEKYLRKCLDSLIVSNDLMQVLEVLVVNDGSKDASSQIGHEYESKYPHTFIVIDKENGNYGSCVNRGLKEAKGKYVKVLDADDYFDTNEFVKVLSFLMSNDYDLVLTDFSKVDEDGYAEPVFRMRLPYNESLQFKDILGEPARTLYMHRIIYKTENVRSIGYHQTEGISYTDQEWMGEPMSTVKSVFYLKSNLYQYLVGREGQTINPNQKLKSVQQYIHAVFVLVDLFLREPKESAFKEYLKCRLNGQMDIIYGIFLCEHKHVDLTPLFEFDKIIKEKSEELYQIGYELTTAKLKAASIWRKWKYKNSGVLIPTYCKFVWGVQDLIKRIKN